MKINTAFGKIIVGFNQTREISESCEKSGFDSRLDFRTLFIRLIHFKLSYCFEGRCWRAGSVIHWPVTYQALWDLSFRAL